MGQSRLCLRIYFDLLISGSMVRDDNCGDTGANGKSSKTEYDVVLVLVGYIYGSLQRQTLYKTGLESQVENKTLINLHNFPPLKSKVEVETFQV